MAHSTAETFLKYSTDGTTFSDLVDIINYPDLGSTPSKIDTTTLSAKKFKTSILGLQEVPDLVFEALYDETKFTTIAALDGKYHFQLLFGDAGVDGGFTWQGTISVFALGGAVDEARKMQITLSAETEITPIA